MLLHIDVSYLGRITEYPTEVRVVGECPLHAVYGIWDIGLGQGDDFDRHDQRLASTA